MKTTCKTFCITAALLSGALTAIADWQATRGPDGRVVNYGPQCALEQGPDARMVCVPNGWDKQTGPDGRMVAVPPGGTAEAGPDGHIVPLPPDDYRLEDYHTYYFILRIQSITKQEEELESGG